MSTDIIDATAEMVWEGYVLLTSNEVEVSGAEKRSAMHRIVQIMELPDPKCQKYQGWRTLFKMLLACYLDP